MTQPSFDEKPKVTNTQDELYEIDQSSTAGEILQYAAAAEVEERTTWFIWLLVACCTISGLLFGMSHALHL